MGVEQQFHCAQNPGADNEQLGVVLDELSITADLPLFFAVDEIFRGTNNRERLIGSRAYICALAGQRGFGLISTHDLALIRLEEEVAGVTNYHFRNGIRAYGLRLLPAPRPQPSDNALRIMAMEGLPMEG